MHSHFKKVHLIAIGGSVMHSLAIALKQQGVDVTGSDDKIFEPSMSNLKKYDILPENEGWYPEKITNELDAIILGMHAKADNSELKKAQELGLKIYSYPEFIYQQAKNKQRIVISGSHGKTTICAMIMHVLKHLEIPFDYVIGAKVQGFNNLVSISNDAPIIILEGDEYPSSTIDLTPKFLNYHHHIGLISGIAWDHANIYPTFEDYVKQFDHFADASPKAGTLIVCEEDNMATVINSKEREDVTAISYKTPDYVVENGKIFLINSSDKKIPLNIFGKHNLQNLNGALAVLKRLAINETEFYEAISSFKGASLRLELIQQNDNSNIYRDFAHAPSKVEASVDAIKELYPNRPLTACLELHTYSSLNDSFINNYKNTLNRADEALIYYNPTVVKQKGLPPIDEKIIQEAFGHPNLKVFKESDALAVHLKAQNWSGRNLILMSSGNFDQLNLQLLTEQITA